MTGLEVIVVALAGLAAGTVNTIVGSGTLITFPVLLAVGYPPLVANVSNTVGLVPGSITGAIGYRVELEGRRALIGRLGCASAAGGLTGALLLLALPADAFEVIVPVLIALALVLVIAQPRLARALAARRDELPHHGGPWLLAGIYSTGVYGGYFGAAQGILLLGVMGVALTFELQEINAVKNVLASIVNGVAALIFVIVADVAWLPVALLALGAAIGGVVGARAGRRMPPALLRGLIVIVGMVAIVGLLL